MLFLRTLLMFVFVFLSISKVLSLSKCVTLLNLKFDSNNHCYGKMSWIAGHSFEGDSNKDVKVSDTELKEYLSDTMTYYARRYYGRDQKVQKHNSG